MSLMPTIDVGYCGVHTAFECALAAQECGWLRDFHCSLYDAPGKWGGWASRFLGGEALRNRRVDGLDPWHVREYPFPWFVDTLRRRFGAQDESIGMFTAFDSHCARQLKRSAPSLFVSTERCALKSLQFATCQGIHTVHDCPQLHPVSLDLLMCEAAERAGVAWSGFADGPAMRERKLEEYALAERLMVYSDFQRESFISRGIPAERLFVNPLWVDIDFWYPLPDRRERNAGRGMELLFVGELSFRKGLPFLFEALRQLDAPVHLTLAGRPTGQFPIPDHLGRAEVTAIGPVTKHRLRELYSQSDLMVLPSVADAFGWVAVEAMACGIPVLLTENCGAPVPDRSWRVPVLNSPAIATRIQYYLDNPGLALDESSVCREFAALFTPARFREVVKGEYRKMLA